MIKKKYFRTRKWSVITAFLLAGMILAALSACSQGDPAISSLPSGGELPSAGAPEGEHLFPSSSRYPETESETQKPSRDPETTEAGTEQTDPTETSSEETAAETDTEKAGTEPEVPTESVVPTTEMTEPTEPAVPTTEAPAPQTGVHAIPQDEINAIRARYDGTVHGFGTGFRHNWVDADNRPEMVNNLLATFAGSGADLLAYCSDKDQKCVAFSFQCGTEYGHTNAVLDILAKYNVKSTFYIIHSYGEKNRALVERMIREGHAVGSHTYSCPSGGIANWPLEDQMQDALKMQQYMQDSFGYTMTKYNFNSGYWSEQAIMMMSRMGYQVDFCSCNYSDYDPEASFNAAELLPDLEQCLHPGCIYCFHTTNIITPTILEPLIQYCLAQGYTVIQVP